MSVKNPVGWFEIYTNDIQRAQAFYQSVLAIEFESLPDPSDDSLTMMLFPSDMETYGASGALVHHPEVQAGGMSTLVYFSCDDCSVEESRIVDAGGVVERSKMSIGEHGFITLGRDAEGNMFGLHSMQ